MTAGRTRHVPLRRCAVCRSSLPQSQLIRFARDEAGNWQLDKGRRAGGRGTWVCTEQGCHQRKALGRAFRAQAADVAAQLAALNSVTENRVTENRVTENRVTKNRVDVNRIDQEDSQLKTSQNGGIDG